MKPNRSEPRSLFTHLKMSGWQRLIFPIWVIGLLLLAGHGIMDQTIDGFVLLGLFLLLGLMWERGQRRVWASEQHLNVVLDNVIDAVITIDEHGLIISFRGAAETLFGYCEDEVLGRNVKMLMPQEVAQHHDGYLRNYNETKETHIIGTGREVTGRRKDGTEFPMDLGVGVSEVGGKRVFTGIVRDLSGRKQTERELERYQNDLERLVEQRTEQLNRAQAIAHIGHWKWNIETNELSWSDEVFRIFGLPLDHPSSYEEFIQRVHADDRARLRNAVSRALDDPDYSYQIDHRIVLADGEERNVQERGECLRDEQGRPLRMLGTVQDLTELRRAERELAKSEERLKLAFQGSNDGLWDWDLKTNKVFYSERWMEMLGYGADDWPDTLETWQKLVYPNDLERVLAEVQAVIDGQLGGFKVEFDMRHRDGHWVPILSRGYLQRDPDSGEVLRLVGTHLDLSERVAAEQALKRANEELDERVRERTAELEQSHRAAIGLMRDAERMKQQAEENYDRLQASTAELHKLQQAVEQIPVSVIITNTKGVIEYVNPFTTELTLYDHDELVGKTLSQLESEQPSAEACCQWWQTVTAAGVWHGEIANRKRDGTRYWESCTISPVFSPGDELIHYVAVKVDITEARAMHQALVDAKEAAEAATRAKSNFVANMSHEIRTPMNAIIGMSYLALSSGLNSKQYNYIDKVHRSAEGLQGIINDILDFSKIEAGKLEIDAINFSLVDVMDNLANLLGLKAEQKEIELIFNLSAQLPTQLVGDPLRLGQVLANLGGNALKFTEVGGEILVAVKLQEETPEQALLHITVQDSGIGISPDHQKNLFQSFNQVDSSITRRYGGTGLGLTISKQLVTLMGGTIWVESEAGQGSRFHVLVSVMKQSAPSARLERPEWLSGLRVLLADDNANARATVEEMLVALGQSVDGVASGEAVLERLGQVEAGHYDLLLMDWKMPQMDGIETSRGIRAMPGFSELPIVLMANLYGLERVQQASHGLHLNGFLAKPITPVSLIQNLGSALGKVSAEGPSPIRLQPRVKVNLGPLRGARILLVEDNEINQELALELLVNHGLTVEVANNGQEALEMLDQASFDAVLMDCQMPVMDGQTATRHIRRDGRFQDLPVIAMTANAMLGDRDEILELGMNDYIAKPIRVNEMFATLAKWLRPDLDLEAEPVRPCPATKQTLSLPPMPGIEPEAGLMTTNGDQALYHRLLIKFRDREGEFIQRFDAALSDRQMDEAQRLAHTLKGLAGNIGAHSLQQAAARLERLCTANTDQLHEALSGVESQLQQVLTGLQGLVEEQSPAPTQQDLSQLVPLLRKLHGLVAMNKVDTEGLLDDVRSMLTEPQQQEAFSRVVQAIEGYDFDSAMDELGALMQQLGVDP